MGLGHLGQRLFISLLCIVIPVQSLPRGQNSSPLEDSTSQRPQLSFTSEIAIEAVVDSPAVPLNRNLILTIKVSCTGDIHQYEFQWPEPPDLKRLEIVGTSSANVVSDRAGYILTVKEYRYILKPIGQGAGRIGPVTLLYTNKSTQREHSLSTRAISVDITEPVERGASGSAVHLLAIVGLLVVISLSGGLLYVRKRRSAVQEPQTLIETKSPEERALEELEKVPEFRLAGETKEYYSAISDTVRRYVDRTFALRTLELTTHDIMSNLKMQEVDEETVMEIEKILNACDMVKFAGHEPAASDLDQILSMAQNFFQKRRQGSSTDLNEDDIVSMES